MRSYQHFTTKFSILANVPINYSEESAISGVPIQSVEKLKPRDRNKPDTFITSNSLKIGFKGQNVRKFVILNYWICIKQCLNCARLGNVQRFYKSKDARCINCSGSIPTCKENCQSIKCLLCGSIEHNVLDSVKQAMNIENKSFKENYTSNVLFKTV